MIFIFVGTKGRPKLAITEDQLRLLSNEGYTAKGMAQVFKCSTSTVKKRLAQNNIYLRANYTDISDDSLTSEVQKLHEEFPNSGSKVSTAITNYPSARCAAGSFNLYILLTNVIPTNTICQLPQFQLSWLCTMEAFVFIFFFLKVHAAMMFSSISSFPSKMFIHSSSRMLTPH